MQQKQEEDEDLASGQITSRRPDPDPTLRTMQLVDKAIKSLKEELSTRFEAVETRFISMDKAATLLHDDYVRVPTLLDRAIANLRELVYSEIEKFKHVDDERFSKIDIMFTERDKRSDQLATVNKTAIEAALQAAEKSGAKTELNTNESIKQLQVMFTTSINSLSDKINDVKSRLDRGEGRTSVNDPAMMERLTILASEIKNLSKTSDTGAGHAAGVRDNFATILAVAAFVTAIAIPFLVRMIH